MKFFVALGALLGLVACGEIFRSFDEVNTPADDVALANCRKAARDADPDAYVVYGVYENCTKEAGLR